LLQYRNLFFDKKKSKAIQQAEDDVHSQNRKKLLKTYSRQQRPGRPSPFPPLSMPLYTTTQQVSVNEPKIVSVEQLHPEIQVTTLDNGLRVASRELPSPVAAYCIFVEAGTRYEREGTYGAAHLLERLAYKSTKNRTAAEIVHKMEDIGANITISSSRDYLIYVGECLRQHVPIVLDYTADSIKNPLFLDEEIEEQRQRIAEEFTEASENPEIFLNEILHEIAFKDHPLANTVYTSPETVQKITKDVLHEYVSAHFVGSRMVVTGCGVNHNEFVRLVNTHFGDLPKTSSKTFMDPPVVYVGGDARLEAPADSKYCYAIVAWKAPGISAENYHVAATLRTLMGGGESFSSGGPGKGMYTRLYLYGLNAYSWLDGAEAFLASYSDISLFGIIAKSKQHSALPNLLNFTIDQMTRLKKGFPDVELTRARNQLKCSVFMNLESRTIFVDDMGRQLLSYGRVAPGQELCEKIDTVSKHDIIQLVKELLSSPPTVVVYGLPSYLKKLPNYDKIVAATSLN
jgi:processing peptidase subunit alpha